MTPEGKVLTFAKLRQYSPRRRSLLVRFSRYSSAESTEPFPLMLDFPWISFGCLDIKHSFLEGDRLSKIIRAVMVYLHNRPWTDLSEVSANDFKMWPYNEYRPGRIDFFGAVCLGRGADIKSQEQVEEFFWNTVTQLPAAFSTPDEARRHFQNYFFSGLRPPNGLRKLHVRMLDGEIMEVPYDSRR